MDETSIVHSRLGVDNGHVDAYEAYRADIELVRHKLKFLVALRYSGELSDAERVQYEELCDLERSLLEREDTAA